MYSKNSITFFLYFGISLIILSIILFILSFTNDISLLYSLLSFVCGTFLIILSSRLFRLSSLQKMNNYIENHSKKECNKCHTFNDIDAHFCKNCGYKLDA